MVLCVFVHAQVQFGLKVVSLLTCMRIDLVLGWLNSSVECSDSDARLGAFLHEVVVHGRDAPSYLRMPWFILVGGCVLIVYLLPPFLGVSWESLRMAVASFLTLISLTVSFVRLGFPGLRTFLP